MPTLSRAEIATSAPYPEDVGEVIWEEHRRVPFVAFFGAPAAILAVIAIGIDDAALRIGAVVLALGFLVLLWRTRGGSLIETYALTDRYMTVVQPSGGRVALPLDTIERITLHGDEVRFDASIGTVTLGYVHRQRRLVQALERLVPAALVDRSMPAYCST